MTSRRDLPKRTGHGSPSSIPAVLLARLALHRGLQKRGLGGELLWDALSRAVQASEIAAARVVVVDAIDEGAARFYAHYGFVSVPGNSQRLVQKVSDIAAALKPLARLTPIRVGGSLRGALKGRLRIKGEIVRVDWSSDFEATR